MAIFLRFLPIYLWHTIGLLKRSMGLDFPKYFESETLNSRLGWAAEAMNELVGIGGVDAGEL